MLRFFAKFFNEKPHKPIKIPEELKSNLRNNQFTQMALRRAMKEFRAHLPLLSLAEIAKLSRAHINSAYFIPNLLSSNDPKLEPHLRKNFFKEVLDPQMKSDLEYYEDRILALDRSAESRRNFLLAKEAEEAEKALRAHEEVKRLERLKKVDEIKFRPSYSQVDQILDGREGAEVALVDQHVVLSSRGVVVLSHKPGKMATFKDLTGQELANYICYNLQTAEQALQMFQNADLNENFDANLRAQMVQKFVFLELKQIKDHRLIQLIQSIQVQDLSKKNLANLIWALGELYKRVPKSLSQFLNQLIKRFIELIPTSNSMNLAYAAQGLSNLKISNPTLIDLLTSRFTSILDSIEVPKVPKPSDVSYLNIPLSGPSFFYGSKDLTIPTNPVPVPALFKMMKFLKKNQKHLILNYYYLRASSIINQLSLFELDKYLLLEGLKIFSFLTEQQLLNESIKKCILNMSHLALSYYQEFSLYEVSLVARSLIRTKSYRKTPWFRVLQLKTSESAEFFKTPQELLSVTEDFVKYHVAVKHGRDLDLEPLAWVFNSFHVENSLFNRISEICDSKNLPSQILNEIGKYLGIVGYIVSTTNDLTISSIIAAAVQEYQHPLLKEVPDETLLNLVKSTSNYEEICELAVVFRKHNTKVNWGYFETFFENNKQLINSQPHRIGLAWSLFKKVEVEYISEMLTKTEYSMLKNFIIPEKIIEIDS